MLRAYDMSWLCLHRSESEWCLLLYSFGEDGFVRVFIPIQNCAAEALLH
jgi:hypothetical protein